MGQITGKRETDREREDKDERKKTEKREREGKNRYIPLPLAAVTLRTWNPDTAWPGDARMNDEEMEYPALIKRVFLLVFTFISEHHCEGHSTLAKYTDESPTVNISNPLYQIISRNHKWWLKLLEFHIEVWENNSERWQNNSDSFMYFFELLKAKQPFSSIYCKII